VYRAVVEEAVQENCYDLILDFDRMTFVYIFKRVAYEGGDGFYETTHRGSFVKESSRLKRSAASGPGTFKRRLLFFLFFLFFCLVCFTDRKQTVLQRRVQSVR
jgi:hypothetical protein